MKTQPVLSDLELSILGLFRERPRSGYEIRHLLNASPGAVYPAIRRLQRGGLVEGQNLTEAGRRALRQALSPAIDKDELRRKPDAVAFRMRFLGGKALANFLRDYGRLCEEIAADLNRGADLLSRHDAAVFKARARWAKGTPPPRSETRR
jgi:DNA-binding PadR family transcriptional regulator